MKKAPAKGAGLNFDVLKEAVEFMQANGLAELTWEKGADKISLKTHGFGGASGSPVITFNAPNQISGGGHSHSSQTNQKIIESTVEASKPAGLQITSPFVGTFYRSPAPGAAVYVTEGQVIRPGDVLCIVEAMKLMNEIESEIHGRIVKVLAEDGQPIEYGEPLFLYEKA